MPENEAPQEPVYDHEHDEARQATRRRRAVADWGVGDELFDHMPRRRFSRTGELHRRVSGEERRPARGEDRHGHAEDRQGHAEDRHAARGDDRQGHAEDRHAAHADRGPAPRGEAAPDDAPLREPGGRRTVIISGRPDAVERRGLDAPRRDRRPRTVGDRVGSRPDRVAAWAFALGLLLILVAVATAKADAAVPAHPAAPAASAAAPAHPAVSAPLTVRDFQAGSARR
jgi:hypothetical protein